MDATSKKAVKLLLGQWLKDEENNYSCEFDVDNPKKIPTKMLKRSAYQALRVLKDTSNKK
jgi:hypothetical protein